MRPMIFHEPTAYERWRSSLIEEIHQCRLEAARTINASIRVTDPLRNLNFNHLCLSLSGLPRQEDHLLHDDHHIACQER